MSTAADKLMNCCNADGGMGKMGDGSSDNFMKNLLKQLTCRKSHGIVILDLCNGQHGRAVRLGDAVRATGRCGCLEAIAAFTPYG